MEFDLADSGELRVRIEDESDWELLLEAVEDSRGDLASLLGQEMKEDELWEEYVVPEMAAMFEGRQAHFYDNITRARDRGDKEILIIGKDADLWYGIMNQARLNLMAKYCWEEKGKPSLNQCKDPQERLALLRESFYLHIQSLILEYLWDE